MFFHLLPFLGCIHFLHATNIEVGGIEWKLDKSEEQLVIKLGEKFTLERPRHSDATKITWYFNKNYVDIVTLYENQALNALYADLIECLPSKNPCDLLVVKKLTADMVGEYAFRSGNDAIARTSYNYLLTGYQAPLAFKSSFCNYNSSILLCRNQSYQDTQCTANLLKHVPYKIKASIEMSKCDENTNRTQSTSLDFTLACFNRFSENDIDYSCKFKKDNGDIIDTFYSKVWISYGPKIANADSFKLRYKLEVREGSEVQLQCPYVGFPIIYQWNSTANVLSETGQKLTVPATLAPGVYEYSCQARVSYPANGGEFSEYSSTIYFELKTVKPSGSKENLPLLIGLSIGGVLLGVAVIVIAVYVYFRFAKRRKLEYK